MQLGRPYYSVQFNWGYRPINIKEVAKKLSRTFNVEWIIMVKRKRDEAFASDWIKVSANTLNAYLLPWRTIIFQKKPLPFTQRDIELREKLLALYPRRRYSFLSPFKAS
jgi:hypothetical protein